MWKIALRGGLAALGSGVIFASAVFAATPDVKGFSIKAAFIYNFIKFAEWPGDKTISKQSNIDICVLGDSPLLNTKNVFQAASSEKLKLSLVQENSWQEAAKHCHVLYISDTAADKANEVISGLRNKPVLTVSDIGEFPQIGGIIGFVMNDDKIKLIINTKAAAQAHIRIDAQLLEIALKVI